MKSINIIFKTLALILGLTLVSCNEDLVQDMEVKGEPSITDFSPKSGKVGTEITITGDFLQKIDTVWFGGELGEVKYRINPREIVVKVKPGNKTGKILISGSNGKIETSENFTMEYTVPAMTNYPVSAKTNAEIYIEGNNLDAVVNIYFGSVKGEIITQSEKDMIVRVPFFEDDKVDIILDYNSESGVKQVSTSGKPFELERPTPVITDSPSQGELSTRIVLTGTELTLIDEIWFGTKQGTIQQKSDETLTVLIPNDFNVTTEVELTAKYYGTKTLTIKSNFKVKAVYYWQNVTIYAQSEETPNNFFNAATGDIYGPCDYANVQNDIYFFITWSNSNATFQLNNPNNSASQTKNFKCSGVALAEEKMPNIVKFRILKTTDAEGEFYQKVKNRELEEINQQIITDAGIGNAGTSAPRYQLTSNIFNIGDVLMFQKFASDGSTVLEVGFIEIVSATDITSVTTKSSLTFNCYFQK